MVKRVSLAPTRRSDGERGAVGLHTDGVGPEEAFDVNAIGTAVRRSTPSARLRESERLGGLTILGG